MNKHIIEVTWEPELFDDGGRYVAGVDGRKHPDAPYPGFGKTKMEAVGSCIMGASEYFGIEVTDLSDRPSIEDGDWDEITFDENGQTIYKLNGKVINQMPGRM